MFTKADSPFGELCRGISPITPTKGLGRYSDGELAYPPYGHQKRWAFCWAILSMPFVGLADEDLASVIAYICARVTHSIEATNVSQPSFSSKHCTKRMHQSIALRWQKLSR
ncbi:MAG: hypothetical protein R2788_23510 [Saprospiraceae bacterium]